MISEPVAVFLLSNSPSNRSLEMTEWRRSWPDISANIVLTQSARGGRALYLGVGTGFGLISSACWGGRVLRGSVWEACGSLSSAVDGGVGWFCSISDIFQVRIMKEQLRGRFDLHLCESQRVIGRSNLCWLESFESVKAQLCIVGWSHCCLMTSGMDVSKAAIERATVVLQAECRAHTLSSQTVRELKRLKVETEA